MLGMLEEYGNTVRLADPRRVHSPHFLHALLRGELSFLVVGPKRKDRWWVLPDMTPFT
jgi:hypothetical protein